MMSSLSIAPSVDEEVIDRFLENMDVWQAIFEMLEVKDRIRLEMTNKRLGFLMFEYWKRVTSFDTKYELKSDSFSMSRNAENLSAAFVHICVNGIGDGLRSLTIREKFLSTTVWSTTLASVGEGCPNVETINFVLEDKHGTLDIHFDSFPRLKTLTVSTAEGRFMSASASVFLSIAVSIEVIRGLEVNWREPFENGAQMAGFFADRPSLRAVSLYGLYIRNKSKADIFRVIADRCPHLKSIKLNIEAFRLNGIDYTGVVAVESMKELRLPSAAVFYEMDIVTICKRSPLVEALQLSFHFPSNLVLQSEALSALGALTKLRELRLYIGYGFQVVGTPSLVTEFVRELARNSGSSLRHLYLEETMPLPKAAIETLANWCPKLRSVRFGVCVGEVEPASIRFLIDCIVADPSWIPQTRERTLIIDISVWVDGGDADGDDVDEDEAEAVVAPFKALADPAANLPAGVELIIRAVYYSGY